jgi:peptide/nickel transport system substrate-binding protein
MNVALGDMGTFDLAFGFGTTRSYLDSLYDYVIGASPDGALDSSSGWASEWSSNAEGTDWKITGKDNVVFHDGLPVTSADIKFGVDRMLYNPDPRIASAANIQKKVLAVGDPDPTTVLVMLKDRDIFFPMLTFSKIGDAGAPSHIFSKSLFDNSGKVVANKEPVGSGPYKFKSVAVGDRVEYEAVDKHWHLGVPRIASLTFRLVPEETTRIAMLRTGEVDITLIGRNNVSTVTEAGIRIVQRNGSGVASYRFDDQWVESYEGYGANPLNDPNVRKALDWHALDRGVLGDAFMAGMAEPTMNYPSGPRDGAYKKLPVPEYDPAKARQMLAAAGYPNGFEMDWYIVPRPALPEGPEIAEAMAVWWEDIGIKVNRKPVDYSVYRSALVGGGGVKAFDKPTGMGVWFLSYGSVASSAFVTLHIKFAFATNQDPTLASLAGAWKKAANQETYTAAGQAYMQAKYDAGDTMTLLSTGEIFAASDNVAQDWSLGASPYSFQIELAAVSFN